MNAKQLISQILENAKTINKLQENVEITFKDKSNNTEAWREACKIANDLYNELAFPGGLANGLDLLKKQDPEAIDVAIIYLQANPHFFRSGYHKEKIIGLLKKSKLTKKQISKLQDIIIDQIETADQRAFKEYCRLAPNLLDDQFKSRIKFLQNNQNNFISERASQLLKSVS